MLSYGWIDRVGIGEDGQIKRGVGTACFTLQRRGVGQGGSDQLQSGRGGALEVRNDMFQNRLSLRFPPAVPVGRQGQQGVGKFSFPGEASFGHGGHSNDVCAHGSVHVRFGASGKSRSFHAQVGSRLVGRGRVGSCTQPVAHDCTAGVGQFDMDCGIVIEGPRPMDGSINDLITEHDGARCNGVL